jgi:hypothetical protein
MPSAPTVLPRPDRAAPVPAGRPAAPALPGPGSRPGHPDRSRHQLVVHLLDGTCRTGDVPRIAARLGLPVHGRYTVVAVAGGSAAARIAARTLVEGPAHWHTTASGAYGIVVGTAPLRPDPLPPDVRLGVGLGARGLARVAQDRRRADLALAVGGAGVVRLGEHLPAALVAGDHELGTLLALRVLGPVLATGDEAEVLLRTLETWLDADGSTRTCADRLGCHRNTVTNRLHRIERLTGHRVDRPRDVVELALALARARSGPLPPAAATTGP